MEIIVVVLDAVVSDVVWFVDALDAVDVEL